MTGFGGGGLGLQTMRDRVLAFDANGAGWLTGGEAPGAGTGSNADLRAAPNALVEQGPG